MYVRIARFEDAEGDWDARIEIVRKRMTGETDSPMTQARDAADGRALEHWAVRDDVGLVMQAGLLGARPPA